MSKTNPNLFTGEIFEIVGKNKWKNLFGQTDISTLVLFRVVFGCIMLWEVFRYIEYDWIYRYWIEPKMNLTYWPFDWVHPLPGDGMYFLFYALGILAFFITIGFAYRISTVLFFLGFSYQFLLEQTRYLNHFYLVILVAFIMIFLPLNRSMSVDAKINPKIKSETASLWCLWLIRFVLALPYFFGGIAKINYDWLHGQPLAIWLADDTSLPIIGKYFTENWMILFMSYSGMLLDLLIIPVLLFKRTRLIGFIAILSFHLINDQIFTIGIFPWFMIFATTLFFSPSWPRKIYNALRPEPKKWNLDIQNISPAPIKLNKNQKIVAYFLAAWFLFHITVPLRHFIIPGNSNWTEEGHRYAWHMKLRTKRGIGQYKVVDKSNGETIAFVDPADYLEDWQLRKMAGRPYLIHAFVKQVAKAYSKKGIDVAIYAQVIATLNGRAYQDLIDPNVDLANQKRPSFPPASWIIPLTTPLENRLEDQ